MLVQDCISDGIFLGAHFGAVWNALGVINNKNNSNDYRTYF